MVEDQWENQGREDLSRQRLFPMIICKFTLNESFTRVQILILKDQNEGKI